MESSTSRPEYDSLLGGEESLPTSINVRNFVTARIQEIKALTEVAESPSNTIVKMRSFPNHMKRRAMSHNIKRIPKRLRELHAALRQKSNTREGPTKFPRRKYRRRPKELLKEYVRRQKKYIWLETHIWHAKRFRMVNNWGYKLPLTPTDKSYRACYRAGANHCLLQDISYYNCIELSGSEAQLLSGLSRHTRAETGLTFAARATISGAREGSVMFYLANKYPFGCVGEINFIWKPLSSLNRTLWLWSHPGCNDIVVKELITTFNLTEVKTEEAMDYVDCESADKVEMKKIELRNVPYIRTPKYSNNEGIMMVILKDTLNRFHLSGPISQAILSQSLRPIRMEELEEVASENWINQYYFGENTSSKKAAIKAQYNYWLLMKKFYSPGQFTPRCVVPFTVVDPRFTMPFSRTKAVDTSSVNENSTSTLLDVSQLESPIWSYVIRDTVTNDKLSTEQLNRMRSEKLVPGLDVERSEHNVPRNLHYIPILLIQKPGIQNSNKRLGYGSGWDVISPCGYGMPFWLSFILSGARAGGLREEEAFSRESAHHANIYQPDTSISRTEENNRRKNKTEEFFRLPPAKRRNYIKLNIPTPFHCPWSVLIKDWDGTEEFYVLRDKKLLLLLQDCTKGGNTSGVMGTIDVQAGALVPVRLDLKGKGVMGPNAHICLLQENDLKDIPKEPQKKDDFKEERSLLHIKHKKLLRHLAKKRHVARVSQREEKCKSPKEEEKDWKEIIRANASKRHIKEHAETMSNLWLPPCTTIKDTCLRTVIGFVCDGDFCFTEGKISGIGYVVLTGLREHLRNRILNKNFILIRSTNTDQYRIASISIATY